MGSRFLAATTPGGLLSTVQGLLSAGQQLVVQAIANGTYFYINQSVTGAQNGSNQTYALPATAKPITSVEVFYNGVKQTYTTDYTVAVGGTTFTFTTLLPVSSDVIKVNFLASPV